VPGGALVSSTNLAVALEQGRSLDTSFEEKSNKRQVRSFLTDRRLRFTANSSNPPRFS
jgi:hypothetical protein